jgi:hydroxymethylpyrimidine/phosphomethylpyrimidine kinase
MALERPVALTVAGSDSGGGAGIVADLKVFEALGVWGTVAIAAVTAQNTLGVSAIHLLAPEMIRAQIEAVAGDIGVDAAKTGMLGSAAGVRAAAAAIRAAGIERLVVDPVLTSKHGDALLAGDRRAGDGPSEDAPSEDAPSEDALDALRSELLPLAAVLTPNLPEAAALLDWPVTDRKAMVAAAEALRRMGPGVVLLKGGHLDDEAWSPDLVCSPDGVEWLEGHRLAVRHTHGTGCVLSAAIAGYLALGRSPKEACAEGKRFVTAAIGAGLPLGRGIGPVDPAGVGRFA